jgi:hypothetical protein
MCIRCILCLMCPSCKELRDNCGTKLDQAQRYFNVNRSPSLSFGPFTTSWLPPFPLLVFGSVPRGSTRSGLLRLRVFDLKTQFPLVGRLGHEWVPERTPAGAKRNGACDPFPRNDSLSQGLGTWTNSSLVFDNLVSVQVKFLSP